MILTLNEIIEQGGNITVYGPQRRKNRNEHSPFSGMFLIFMELIVALDCSVLNNFGRLSPRIPFKNVLVFCENVLECVVEFPIDLLDLELLPHDFVLNVVDAVIQRGDVNLAVLNAGFRAL